MWIRRVFSFDSHKLECLLLSLSPEDRKFRFCAPTKDESIVQYVRSIAWRQVCIYGVYNISGGLVAAVELVPSGRETELAIAVASTHKRRGLGRILMSRAMLHAKVRGLRKLQILCTSDNVPMQRLAKGVGMMLEREYGEVAGKVTVAHPTAADYMAASSSRFDSTVGTSIIWIGGTFRAYHKAMRAFNLYFARVPRVTYSNLREGEDIR